MPGKKESEEERREQLLTAAYEVAAREGVGGLTVRAIAAEASVSHGLVHFHFKSKEQLVRALLEWVLAATLELPPYVAEGAADGPLQRLHGLLEREMDRLSGDPRRMRLFLEFWAIGTRDPWIGGRFSAELERYRSKLRAVTERVLRDESAAFEGVTADGLAAVAVSFVNGCAVQAMIDPHHFDIDEYLAAVRVLVDRQVEGARKEERGTRSEE
jgi:TetR/AcrR family transcriptional regulator, transcriptional repressor of bet genes